MSPCQVLLTDGALGTEYQRLGLPPGACADLWTLDAPHHVFAVTKAYADAGSQVVLTTTFRANPISLSDYGRASDTAAINRAAALLAREAAPGRMVFGDIGPVGKALGSPGAERHHVEHAFAEQCDALAAAGVDAVVLETFGDMDEAQVALNAAMAAGLKAAVSFAFFTGERNDLTATGTSPEDVARRMTDEGAWAVGANCGAGLESHVEICRRMRAATSLPIWIKPNAGLPQMAGGGFRYAATAEDFAKHVLRYCEAGATFIGGCCGTTPEFIRAAASRLPSPSATLA